MIDTTGQCSACGQTVGIDTIHTCSPQVTAPTPERRVGEAELAALLSKMHRAALGFEDGVYLFSDVQAKDVRDLVGMLRNNRAASRPRLEGEAEPGQRRWATCAACGRFAGFGSTHVCAPQVEKTLAQRFAEKVKLGAQAKDCWEWTARRDTGGYGVLKSGRKNRRAHRISYEMFVGPIPEGLQLDHLCRVRHCVNPEHLEPVTLRVNSLRSNGVSAANAKKTHCKRGHPFSGENLLVTKKGTRQCRACRPIHDTANRKRRAARLAALSLPTPAPEATE